MRIAKVNTRTAATGEKPDLLDRLLTPSGFVLAIALHCAIAVVSRVAQPIALLYSTTALGVGLWAALYSKRPEFAVYAAAYITTSEVLSRMTAGLLVYEHGKYALLAVVAAAILRFRKFGQPLAGIQFLLLVPSVVLTLAALPLKDAREAITFNLSGPLTLCLCVTFFAAVKLTHVQFTKLLLLALCPLIAIAVLTIYNLSTVTFEFEYVLDSNPLVGFGPNQISAVLGMGVMIGVVAVAAGRLNTSVRVILCGAILLMAAQSMMTFSRNGVINATVSLLAGAPFLVRDKQSRTKLLVAIPVVALVFGLLVFPWLNDLTAGKLGERFQQTGSTGRSEIIGSEMRLWMSNFVAGVGPGMGRYLRDDHWEVAAHTEYSRLLAEHGLLGLVSLLIYPLLIFSAVTSARSGLHRGFAVCALTWGMVFMATNATRLAAPGFLVGLACIQVTEPKVLPERARGLRRLERVEVV